MRSGDWMDRVFARNPSAVAVVESALIFEVERDARARGESETVLADWRRRLDRIVVVTAPDELKIARYAARVSPTEAGRKTGPGDSLRRGWEAGPRRQVFVAGVESRRSRCPPPSGSSDSRCNKSRPRRLYFGKCWRQGRPSRPGRGAVATLQAESNKLPADGSLK